MQTTLPLDPPAPGMSRRDAMALLDETGRALGLSAARLRVLLRLVGSTDQADWKDPDATPTFYGRQEHMADRLGITSRQLRTHERALVRDGYLDASPLANGHRHAAGKWGLSLGPVKAMLSELVQRRDALRAEHQRKRELQAERGAARRKAVDLAKLSTPEQLAAPPVADLLEKVRQWPKPDRLMRMKLAVLDHHVAEAVETVAELEAALGGCPVAPADAPPAQRSLADEKRKRDLARVSSPERLLRLASPEMRLHALREQDAGSDSETALLSAAEVRRPELGVSRDCWREARQRMGQAGATLALLLVDANRDHPTKPVRNPGAVLRSMARKFSEGRYNVVGGLIGLERRRRQAERGGAP